MRSLKCVGILCLPEKVSFSKLKSEKGSKVYLLGYNQTLEWKIAENGVTNVLVPEKF